MLRFLIIVILCLTLCACGTGGTSSNPAASPSPALKKISGDSRGVLSPVTAANSAGVIYAAWPEEDGSKQRIMANRYDGQSWGTPTPLSSAAYADSPAVVVSQTGEAVVLWRETPDYSTPILHARRYTTAYGWEGDTIVSSQVPGLSVSEPRLVIGAAGVVTAMWTQASLTQPKTIFASRLVSGRWSTPVAVSDGATPANAPSLAANAAGNLMAAWVQNGQVYSTLFNGTWFGPTKLTVTPASGSPARPEIALAPDGRAVAVWEADVSGERSVWACRYDSDTGWGYPVKLENFTGSAIRPKVGIAANGNALVVFSHQTGVSNDLYSVTLDAATGVWSAPYPLESSDMPAWSPAFSVSPGGKAAVVWSQGTTVRKRLFSPEKGWGAESVVAQWAATTEMIGLSSVGEAFYSVLGKLDYDTSSLGTGSVWGVPF